MGVRGGGIRARNLIKHLLDRFRGQTLGAFDGETKGTIPHQTRQDTKGSTDAKQDRVKVLFNKAIMLDKTKHYENVHQTTTIMKKTYAQQDT